MRVTTRLVSAVAAALLTVAAVVALIELLLAALGRTPWVVDWRSLETFGQEHSWDDAAVRLIALALGAIGMALLVAALRRRPAVTLDSHLGTELTDVSVRRRPLEALVDEVARSVDGVADATSHWNGHAITVHVTTRRAVTAGIDGAVGPRIDAVLRRWGIDGEPARVTVRSIASQAAPLPPPPSAEPVAPFGDWPPADQPAQNQEALR